MSTATPTKPRRKRTRRSSVPTPATVPVTVPTPAEPEALPTLDAATVPPAEPTPPAHLQAKPDPKPDPNLTRAQRCADILTKCYGVPLDAQAILAQAAFIVLQQLIEQGALTVEQVQPLVHAAQANMLGSLLTQVETERLQEAQQQRRATPNRQMRRAIERVDGPSGGRMSPGGIALP